MENKKYSLIVQSSTSFSLICDADQDGMTDYFPGIWSIESQKRAIYFAQKELDRGNEVKVRNYDNPSVYPVSNKLIKTLGLKQPLFEELPPLMKTVNHDNLKIKTLSDLKRFLVPGQKFTIVNYGGNDTEVTRETVVKRAQTTSVVLDRNGVDGLGSDSWLELGKASEWSFDSIGATKHYTDSRGRRPTSRIIYPAN